MSVEEYILSNMLAKNARVNVFAKKAKTMRLHFLEAINV